MAINRFTQLTPSRFNPMSYQEIMATPLAQRQRHDNLLAQQEMLRQGLAKVDPLDVHFNEATQLKSDINNRINAQAEQLAREGINPNSTSDFIRLNREYQDLMSPTGRLGQINNAKQVYNKQLSDYLEDATKTKGWSRERALNNWQLNNQRLYTGYDSNRNITNIGAYGAPKYIDVMERVQSLAKEAGLTTEEFANASGSLQFDVTGNKYVVNRNSEGVNESNYNQLKAIADTLTLQLFDKNSELNRSVIFDQQDPMRVLGNIVQQLDIYRTDKKSNKSGYSINNVEWYKPEEITTNGTIISNDSTLKSNALEQTSYADVVKEIEKLKSSEITPAQKSKLEDLRELQASAEVKMLKDVNYIKLQDETSKLKSKIYSWGKDNNLPKRKDESEENYFTRLNLAGGNNNSIDKIRSEYTSKNNELTKIKNNYWRQSSSVRHNYSYLPSNPKEESQWNLYNENIFNTLKASNLSNTLDLTSIYTEGGTKKNISNKDVQNIEYLLKNADSKSFKINNIKTYGDNKTPEITVSFNTIKDAEEFDMQGTTGLFKSSSDNYGGSEKPVTITFKLKNLSNSPDTGSAAGYRNLSGAISSFWRDKGGINEITGNPQGREVHNSLIENTYRNLSNEQLYQRAQSDPDAREALMIRVAKRK